LNLLCFEPSQSAAKPGEKKRLKSKLAQKLKRKKVRRQPADSDSKPAPPGQERRIERN
jgi:hypothetical protein